MEMALTATATPIVQDDIRQQLGLTLRDKRPCAGVPDFDYAQKNYD